MKRIVMPLPENLVSLKKEEERVVSTAMGCIELDRDLHDHLSLIEKALDVVFDFTHVLPFSNEDELALKFVGARLFNSALSSLRLMTAGYYQSAGSLIRDLFETHVLFDYFWLDGDKAKFWRTCTPKQRVSAFKIRPMLVAIHHNDTVIVNRRYRRYRMLCEYAVHPTHRAAKLIAVDGLVKIGPFFRKENLEATLVELGLNLSRATLSYCRLFRTVPKQFAKLLSDFHTAYREWFRKYSTLHTDAEDERRLWQEPPATPSSPTLSSPPRAKPKSR